MVPTLTEPEKSNHHWTGETGYINKEMLAKYMNPAKSPIYYIVGPPGMGKKIGAELGVFQIG